MDSLFRIKRGPGNAFLPQHPARNSMKMDLVRMHPGF